MVWAKPVRSRHGPSRPNAGMRIITARGLAAWIASQPRPKFSITRGEKFSTTASASATRRSTSSRPSGRLRSRVTDRLLAFAPWNTKPHSHHRSTDAGFADVKRMPSGRWTDSTLTTSAPRAPSTWVAAGPAQKAVKSTMRTPSRGSGRSAPVAGGVAGRASAPDQSTAPVCSPSAGAGRKPGRGRSPRRYGTRGWVNPCGPSTKLPRSTNCSWSTTVAPSSTGATGMRSAEARSTISAVVCRVVHGRT